MPLPHFLQKPLLAAVVVQRAPVRVGLPHEGQTSITFEIAIGISFDSRPPCGFRWLRRMCL